MFDTTVDSGTLNINVSNNSDFRLELSLFNTDNTPMDLSNITKVEAWYRVGFFVTSYLPFVCTITDAVNGQIVVTMPHSSTSTIAKSGVWDLLLTDSDGVVTTLLRGKAIFNNGVTQVQ